MNIVRIIKPLLKLRPVDWAILVIATGLNIGIIVWAVTTQVDSVAVLSSGMLSLFIATLANSATLFSPIPTFVAVFLAAEIFPPIQLVLLISLAAAIGESAPYMLGKGIEVVVDSSKWHKTLKRMFLKFPFIFLVIWVALPNPVQSIGQVFAGTVKYPYWRYFLATLLGNVLWYTLVVSVGRFVF